MRTQNAFADKATIESLPADVLLSIATGLAESEMDASSADTSSAHAINQGAKGANESTGNLVSMTSAGVQSGSSMTETSSVESDYSQQVHEFSDEAALSRALNAMEFPTSASVSSSVPNATTTSAAVEEAWQIELIDEFVESSGGSCTRQVAKLLLEACSYDMNEAMVLYIENPPAPTPAVAPVIGRGIPLPGRPPLQPLLPPGHSDFMPPAGSESSHNPDFPPLPFPADRRSQHYPYDYARDSEDDDDDYKQVDQYDEFGVRRPDPIRHKMRLHHSPRSSNRGKSL